MKRFRGPLLDLLGGLWFIPVMIAAAYGALAVALVEVDKRTHAGGGPLFAGDASAARTVLSVISGSLITVAGLTFSITIVVLQLASSQFSPRMLRTFFGDRLTQATVGSYVGIFAFSILVLRSVDGSFVPRLGVSGASVLAIAAVALLIVFIHHVSQLIQVSYLTGNIAARTLKRLDVLFPSDTGAPREEADSPPAEKPGLVRPSGPGYVRLIEVETLSDALGDEVARAEVLVRPGDFVSGEEGLAAIWPARYADEYADRIRKAFLIARERDLEQDVAFGLRQLVDTAVKAMSPGINDPTTAFTCVGYVRSILVTLSARPMPPVVRHCPGRSLTLVVRRREFEEYLEFLVEIARYSAGDPRVTGAVLAALRSICETASRAGAIPRAEASAELAATVAANAGRTGRLDGDLSVEPGREFATRSGDDANEMPRSA